MFIIGAFSIAGGFYITVQDHGAVGALAICGGLFVSLHGLLD